LAIPLLFLSLWPLIDVAFLSHRFPAPFLTGVAFWRPYSRVVGGPAEYLSNLFSQTYSRHWAGVLAFTLLALSAWAVAHGALRRFHRGNCNWAAVAFSGLVLALAGRWLAVVYVLPMLAGLAAAWLYMTVRERAKSRLAEAAVLAFSLAGSGLLYHAFASGFLYLCLMAALFEWLNRKRALWGLAWLAAGAAVPYGVSFLYYEPDVAARYLRWVSALEPGRDHERHAAGHVPVGRRSAPPRASSWNGSKRRRPPGNSAGAPAKRFGSRYWRFWPGAWWGCGWTAPVGCMPTTGSPRGSTSGLWPRLPDKARPATRCGS
jgi:hypothetical protein